MWAVAGRAPREGAARRVASAAGRAAKGTPAVAPVLPETAAGAGLALRGAPARGIRSTAAATDSEYWRINSHSTPQHWFPRKSAASGWGNNYVEPNAPDGGPYIPRSMGDEPTGGFGTIPRSEDSHLLSRHSEGLRIIYLSKPRSLNSLDADTVTRLRRRLEALDTNPAVSSVVIKGTEDRVFCTGTDYKSFWQAARGDRAERRRVLEYMREEYALQWLVHTMTKPVMVVGHGVTSSTGFSLAANAGFGYATPSTKVIIPEASMGLVPSGGAAYHLARTRSGVGMFAALTSLPVDGELAYWGGLLPYATTSDIVEGLVPDVAGRLGNAPLRSADLWADPQYRKTLAIMRAGLPEEKAEWLASVAEQATDPIAFDRLVDLEMWHKALKAGRPDIANDIAEGAMEGEEPDYEGLYPINMDDPEDAALITGMGVDWFESREALGFDGVATPAEPFEAAAHAESGTTAASLAAQWGAVPAAPSREALFQLRAIERCFGGHVGKGDPVLVMRDDVRPARGGGSFLQPPPDAAREALDAASSARLRAATDAELFDSDAGRRMGLAHGVSPAEESVRRRWRAVADRSARPEYWRERAAARAGLTVTPPRPDSVRPGDPHSGLATLSGTPAPPPKGWESGIGVLEGKAQGKATGVRAAVLAAHEALGLPAHRVTSAGAAEADPSSAEAARRGEELRLRGTVDAAVRAGVRQAWPLGWLPASTVADCCERAGAPTDADTRAVVRFATAVATARVHGQPDLALVPRQHWDAQRAEELRRRLAPGRMSDAQWARLQAQFPFLVQHLFGAEPRDLELATQLKAADVFAGKILTAGVEARAEEGVRFMLAEAERRGVPLRGAAAHAAKEFGLDAGIVPLHGLDGEALNAAAAAGPGTATAAAAAGGGSAASARQAGRGPAPAPRIHETVRSLLGGRAAAAEDAVDAVGSAGMGLTAAERTELLAARHRLASLLHRVDADRAREAVEARARGDAEAAMRDDAAAGAPAALSPEEIEALEAAEAATARDARGRAMPGPLSPADFESALAEAAALRDRLAQLSRKQAAAVRVHRSAVLNSDGILGASGPEADPETSAAVAAADPSAAGEDFLPAASGRGAKPWSVRLAAAEARRSDRSDAATGLLPAVADAVSGSGGPADASLPRMPAPLVADEDAARARALAGDAEAVFAAGDAYSAEELEAGAFSGAVRARDMPGAHGRAHDAMQAELETTRDGLGNPMPLDSAGPVPTASSSRGFASADALEEAELSDRLSSAAVDLGASVPVDRVPGPMAPPEPDRDVPADSLRELDVSEYREDSVTGTIRSVMDPVEFPEAGDPSAEIAGAAGPVNVYERANPFRQQLESPVDIQWQPRIGEQSQWTAPPEFLDPAMTEPENFSLAAEREPLAFLGRYDPADPTYDDGYVVPGRLGVSMARAEEGVLPRAVRFTAADPAPRRQEGAVTAAIRAAVGSKDAPADKGISSARRVRQVARSLRRWYRHLQEDAQKRFESLRPVEAAPFGHPKGPDGRDVPLVHSDPGQAGSTAELLAQASTLVRAINQTLPTLEAGVVPMARAGIAARLGAEETASRAEFDAGAADRERFAAAADELGLEAEAEAARSAQYTPLFPPEAVDAAASEHSAAAAQRVHFGVRMARALLAPSPLVGESAADAAADAERYGGADPAGALAELGIPGTRLAMGDSTPADRYASGLGRTADAGAGAASGHAAAAAAPPSGSVAIAADAPAAGTAAAFAPPSTGLPAHLGDIPGFAVLDDRKRKVRAAAALGSVVPVPGASGASPSPLVVAGEAPPGGLQAEAPVRSALVSAHGSLGLFARGDGTFEPWASGGAWRGASDVDRRPALSRAHLPGNRSAALARSAWIDQAYRANEFAAGRVILGGKREAAARERVVDKASDALAAFEAARVGGDEEAASGVLGALLQSLAVDLDPVVQATRSLVGASGMTYPSLEAHDQAILAVRAGVRAAHLADARGGARSSDHELPAAAQGSVDFAAYERELHAADVSRRGLDARAPASRGGLRGPSDLAAEAVPSPPADAVAAEAAALSGPLPGEAAAAVPDAPSHVTDPELGGRGADAKVAEVADLLRRIASDRTRDILAMAGVSFESLTRDVLRRDALREAIARGPSAAGVAAARTAVAKLASAMAEADRSQLLDPSADAARRAALSSGALGRPDSASRSLFGATAPASDALGKDLAAPVRAGDATAGVLAADEAAHAGEEAASAAAAEAAAAAARARAAAAAEAGSRAAASLSAVADSAAAAGIPLEADGLPPLGADAVDPATGLLLPHAVEAAAVSAVALRRERRARGFTVSAQEARDAAAMREAFLTLDRRDAQLAQIASEIRDVASAQGELLSQEDAEEMAATVMARAPATTDELFPHAALALGATPDGDVVQASGTDPLEMARRRVDLDDAHFTQLPAMPAPTPAEAAALRRDAFGPGSLRLYGEAVAAQAEAPGAAALLEDAAEPTPEEERRVLGAWAVNRVDELAEQALDARLLGRPDLAAVKDAERAETARAFGVPDTGALTASQWLARDGSVEDQLRGQLSRRFEGFERQEEARAHVDRFGQAPEWAGPELRARLIGISQPAAEARGAARAQMRRLADGRAASALLSRPGADALASRAALEEAAARFETLAREHAGVEASAPLGEEEKDVILARLLEQRRADFQDSAADPALPEAAVEAFRAAAASPAASLTARLATRDAAEARVWLDRELRRGGASGAEAWAAMTRLAKADAAVRAAVRDDPAPMAAWLHGFAAARTAAAHGAGADADAALAASVSRVTAAPAAPGTSFGAGSSASAEAAREAADETEVARRAAVALGARPAAGEDPSTIPGVGFARARLDDAPLPYAEVERRLLARQAAGNDELVHDASASDGRLAPDARVPRAPDGSPILIDEESWRAAEAAASPAEAEVLAAEAYLARHPVAAAARPFMTPSLGGPASAEADSRVHSGGDLAKTDPKRAAELARQLAAADGPSVALQVELNPPSITARTAAGAGLQVLHHIESIRDGRHSGARGGASPSSSVLALTAPVSVRAPNGEAFDRAAARIEAPGPSWAARRPAASAVTAASPASFPTASALAQQPPSAMAPVPAAARPSASSSWFASGTKPGTAPAGTAAPAAPAGTAAAAAPSRGSAPSKGSAAPADASLTLESADLRAAKRREAARAASDLELHVRAMLVQEARIEAGHPAAVQPYLAGQAFAEPATMGAGPAAEPLTDAELSAARADADVLFRGARPAAALGVPPVPRLASALAVVDAVGDVAASYADSVRAVLPPRRRQAALALARRTLAAAPTDADLPAPEAAEAAVRARASPDESGAVVELAAAAVRAALEATAPGASAADAAAATETAAAASLGLGTDAALAALAADALATARSGAAASLEAAPPTAPPAADAAPPSFDSDAAAPAGTVARLRAEMKLNAAAGAMREEDVIPDAAHGPADADGLEMVGLPTPSAARADVGPFDAAAPAAGLSLGPEAGDAGLEALLLARPIAGAEEESAAVAQGLTAAAAEDPEVVLAMADGASAGARALRRVINERTAAAQLEALERRSARRRTAAVDRVRANVLGAADVADPSAALGSDLERAVEAQAWAEAAAAVRAIPDGPDAEARRVTVRLEASERAASLRRLARRAAASRGPSHAVPVDSGAAPDAGATVTVRSGMSVTEAAARRLAIASWARAAALELADTGRLPAAGPLTAAPATIALELQGDVMAAEALLEAAAALPGRRSAWAAVLLNDLRSPSSASSLGSAALSSLSVAGRFAAARLLGDDAARALSVDPDHAARVESLLRLDGLVRPGTEPEDVAVEAAVDARVGALAAEPAPVQAAYRAVCRAIFALGGPAGDVNPAEAASGRRAGLAEIRSPPLSLVQPGGAVAERALAAAERERDLRDRAIALNRIAARRFRAAIADDDSASTASAASAGWSASTASAGSASPRRPSSGLRLGPSASGSVLDHVDSWRDAPGALRLGAPEAGVLDPRAQARLGMLSREEARVTGYLVDGEGPRRTSDAWAADEADRLSEADFVAGDAAARLLRGPMRRAAMERRRIFAATLKRGVYFTAADEYEPARLVVPPTRWLRPDADAAPEADDAAALEADERRFLEALEAELSAVEEDDAASGGDDAAPAAAGSRRRGGAGSKQVPGPPARGGIALSRAAPALATPVTPDCFSPEHPALAEGQFLDRLFTDSLASLPASLVAPALGPEDEREVLDEVAAVRAARGAENDREEERFQAMRHEAALAAAEERAAMADTERNIRARQLDYGSGRDPTGGRWALFAGDDEEAERSDAEARIRSTRMAPSAVMLSNPHLPAVADDSVASADVQAVRSEQALSSVLATTALDAVAGAAGYAARTAAARQADLVFASLGPGSVASGAARATGTVAGVLPLWAEVAGLASGLMPDSNAAHPEVTRRRAAELASYHERYVRDRDRDAAAVGWSDVIDRDKTDRDRVRTQLAMAAESGQPQAAADKLSDEARARVTHDPDQLIHALGLPIEPRVEEAARAVTQRFEVMDDWRTAVPLPRSVDEIRGRLRSEDTPFAREALRAMDSNPQRAVRATHRLLVEAGRSSLARTMQTEWRVNSRLREEPDFLDAAGPRLFGGDADAARDFLPDASPEEIDELFRPLAPADELVLGRREHIERTRRAEQARHEWEEKALDALERGEGDGYLGELFRRRYTHVYDPDHEIFEVNSGFRAEAAARGREAAEEKGFVDAATAAAFIRRGLPATQEELEPRVHPRALAELGAANGFVNATTNLVDVDHGTAIRLAEAAERASGPSSGSVAPKDVAEVAEQLGLTDAAGNPRFRPLDVVEPRVEDRA